MLPVAWNWEKFAGSAQALKWNRRDLPCLEAVVKLTKRRMVAVQAGGNLGIFPKRLAELFTVVYTFEPASENFLMLCKNAPEPNIIRFQAALGATRGFVDVSRERRDGKLNVHEGIVHVEGMGPIPQIPLDDLKLPVCDLFYLDVEGFEKYVLMGAHDTIRRCRPVMSVEVNKNSGYYGITIEELMGLIQGLGYRQVATYHSDRVFVPEEQAA